VSVAGRRIKKVRVQRHPPLLTQEQEEADNNSSRGYGNGNGKRRWMP
jgi:hypothetical protein